MALLVHDLDPVLLLQLTEWGAEATLPPLSHSKAKRSSWISGWHVNVGQAAQLENFAQNFFRGPFVRICMHRVGHPKASATGVPGGPRHPTGPFQTEQTSGNRSGEHEGQG